MFRTDNPETEVKITGTARAMEKAKVLIEGKVARAADSGIGMIRVEEQFMIMISAVCFCYAFMGWHF